MNKFICRKHVLPSVNSRENCIEFFYEGKEDVLSDIDTVFIPFSPIFTNQICPYTRLYASYWQTDISVGNASSNHAFSRRIQIKVKETKLNWLNKYGVDWQWETGKSWTFWPALYRFISPRSGGFFLIRNRPCHRVIKRNKLNTFKVKTNVKRPALSL